MLTTAASGQVLTLIFAVLLQQLFLVMLEKLSIHRSLQNSVLRL
jgi:hypothetical protein